MKVSELFPPLPDAEMLTGRQPVPLTVNTEKGREWVEHEREAIERFCSRHSGYAFSETPKRRPASVDGVFSKDGKLVAVCEVKVRELTLRRLQREFENTWLVSSEKLDRGREAGKLLSIPFVGLLYLLPEKRLLALRITEHDGKWSLDFERRRTFTQRNINGGSVQRLNAFLPLDKAWEVGVAK